MMGSRQFGLFDTQTGQIDEAIRVDNSVQSSWGAWCVRECTEFLVLDMFSNRYGDPTLSTKDLLRWQHEQQLMEWLESEKTPNGGIVTHDAQTFSGTLITRTRKRSRSFYGNLTLLRFKCLPCSIQTPFAKMIIDTFCPWLKANSPT